MRSMKVLLLVFAFFILAHGAWSEDLPKGIVEGNHSLGGLSLSSLSILEVCHDGSGEFPQTIFTGTAECSVSCTEKSGKPTASKEISTEAKFDTRKEGLRNGNGGFLSPLSTALSLWGIRE